MTAAIAGITTSRIHRRVLLRRPESGFFLAPASAGGVACSPGNLSTGSAIAALLALSGFTAGLVGGAHVFLDQLELRDEAVGFGGLQMRQRRLVDLLAQRAKLDDDRPCRGRQVKAVDAPVLLVGAALDQPAGAQPVDQ